jgi:hypothetical protein
VLVEASQLLRKIIIVRDNTRTVCLLETYGTSRSQIFSPQ